MEKLIDRISVFLFQRATTELGIKIYFIWIRNVASRFNKGSN